MKKLFSVLLATVLLTGCGIVEEIPETTTEVVTSATGETTQPETTQPEETTLPEETTAPTLPPHSPMYLENVSPEQMLTYFEEVALNIEYTTSQTGILRKWTEPVIYRITGEATAEDLAVLNDLFARLNTVPGFPGIRPAQDGELANLNIYFQDREEFKLAFSQVINGEEADGAVQFWFWNATHNIYQGSIGYRTDIDQSVRNSVLVEEIINLLGISDTVLREDSITYQYGSDVTALSDVDWVILHLLYDEKMQCGMTREECAQILAQLYY